MCKCGCEALNDLDGYGAEELEARKYLTSLHVLLPGQRFPWRFTKTTATHWKRTNGNRNQWATHEQLAQLIEQGTITNFQGEPQ